MYQGENWDLTTGRRQLLSVIEPVVFEQKAADYGPTTEESGIGDGRLAVRDCAGATFSASE